MALQRTVGNRAVTRMLSDAGRPALQVPQDQSAIDDLKERIGNEEEAVARLKKNGPDLFPTGFTCTAEYWRASYDPKAPWIVSRESQDLDAKA
ncbi:hypothetical protein [Streptomyces sp. 769]|uniref:hypothetical protein n=1 Tax=Streptomyces sp. 769 TaxID=1262452 RepID=UPI00057F0E0D|nr:hypothetical protein [Streptomyces sp. 769]AJC61058.1 hypothetical protein GZL_08530 [Streptomyces sp. 769]